MTASFRNSLFTAAAWLMLAGAALAAPPAVSIDARVGKCDITDKSDITVGDIICFTISVRHDPKVKVNIPSLGSKLGEFLIRDIGLPKPRNENGMVVDSMSYKLATYITGEVSVPAVTISYTYTDDSGKELAEKIDTEPLKIKVNRVSPENATDIKDIKGPVEIPVNWRFYAFWGIVAFVVIVFSVMALLYWTRWRPRAEERARMAPPRPAHELALERLAHIEQMDLIAEGRFKLYYDLVTETLRAYLGARYTLDALEMTTPELLQGLKAPLKDMELRAKVASVLDEGDMVKFAKLTPEMERAASAISEARLVIERTIPAMFTKEQYIIQPTQHEKPKGGRGV